MTGNPSGLKIRFCPVEKMGAETVVEAEKIDDLLEVCCPLFLPLEHLFANN